jgi:hypothetical protein
MKCKQAPPYQEGVSFTFNYNNVFCSLIRLSCLLAIGYQLLVFSFQLLVFSFQLLVFSFQLLVFSYQLSVISFQLSISE